MAQFLYERHSVNVHLNMVKRHIRLARQIKGAEELGTVIEPLYNELLAKTAAANVAAEETEFKRDILTLKDAALDDVVRDVNDACKKYDRDHPGSSVTDNLFPGGISPIVYAPIESEPTLVGKIILAIANLGEGHLLAQYVPHLQAAASEAKSAIDKLHTPLPKKKKKKMADAAVTIAKMNLARQYEQNIYAASAKFGKTFANRLFPVISLPARPENTDEPK